MTTLTVGLPLATLVGSERAETTRAVQAFLLGRHVWTVDGVEHTLTVDQVEPKTQPVGALYNYLLDGDGKMPADRRDLFRGGQEIGVIGVGMNTLDFMVVESGQNVDALTRATQLGVRRFLELCNPQRLYTNAEMDARLRAFKPTKDRALPAWADGKLDIWADEVKNAIGDAWGTTWRRFAAIVVVGGGSILLRDMLARKLGALACFAEDAVQATARGLYKFSILKKYTEPVAVDLGFGGIKVCGPAGDLVMPAAVSINGQNAIGEIDGLKASVRPMHIQTDSGSFYVGANAHKFGRPVQSLDLDRVKGSPEVRALFLGALAKYQAIDLAL